MTASLYDFQQTEPSPQERLRAMLTKIMKRRANVSPNKADGFLTTGTSADSAAEGDGDNTTTSPGATPGQQ
jgi:hypothetical protein